MLDQISNVLGQLGINIGVNVFSQYLYDFFNRHKNFIPKYFEKELQDFLDINGAKVTAKTIIDAFIHHGLLTIINSTLYAPDRIIIGADKGAAFSMKNSTSKTNSTQIVVGKNFEVRGSNAAIIQDADGSIRFCVGKA